MQMERRTLVQPISLIEPGLLTHSLRYPRTSLKLKCQSGDHFQCRFPSLRGQQLDLGHSLAPTLMSAEIRKWRSPLDI